MNKDKLILFLEHDKIVTKNNLLFSKTKKDKEKYEEKLNYITYYINEIKKGRFN